MYYDTLCLTPEDVVCVLNPLLLENSYMPKLQLLGVVAEKVRQASGSARQVCSHKKEHKYLDIKGSLLC